MGNIIKQCFGFQDNHFVYQVTCRFTGDLFYRLRKITWSHMQLFSIEYYAAFFPEGIGQQFNKTHTDFLFPGVLNFFIVVTSLVNTTYLKQECLKEMIDDLL